MPNTKVIALETENDATQLVRMVCNMKILPVSWRDDRRYMLAESAACAVHGAPLSTAQPLGQFAQDPTVAQHYAQVVADPQQPNLHTATMMVTGYLRGNGNLNTSHLVHITGHGDFQISRIDRCAVTRPDDSRSGGKKKKKQTGMDDDMDMKTQAEAVVERKLLQEIGPNDPVPSLQELQPIDPLAHEQSIITEEELNAEPEDPGLKPGGLSAVQKIWDMIGDDDDDEPTEANMTDLSFLDSKLPEDNEDPMENDGETPMDAMAEKQKLERQDMEYPDEVDTPLNIPARKRFERYRGLKSFRNTYWDPRENLPLEYSQIFDFESFATTQKMTVNLNLHSKLMEMADDEDNKRTESLRVTLYVECVPISVIQAIATSPHNPLLLWQIYEVERKVSVLHTRVLREQTDYDAPIKGKDPLMCQLGFRRFMCQPIYSQDVVNTDKCLVERFLMPKRWAVASFYGHITFLPATVLFFAMDTGRNVAPLVASGTLIDINPNKLLIKRIVLTGSPVDVHKSAAVIRHMFFDPEDIRYFKPVELYTKYGSIGHIREPRGTKGYMKCTFDGHIKTHDTVCMSLYKRQYPKWIENRFTVE